MQFIDQAPAYRAKAVSPDAAIASGRARLDAVPGAERLAVCFRPELEIATAFDRSIHARLKFDVLPTDRKLDLMIDELLPGFFHPEALPMTGRARWVLRFVVDGTVTRTLQVDESGIRRIDGGDAPPDMLLETDIVTLMAMLRFCIADHHRSRKDRALPSGPA